MGGHVSQAEHLVPLKERLWMGGAGKLEGGGWEGGSEQPLVSCFV